jgi:hypothetical protein
VAQTWVSGVGDDANVDCTRTAPCKTFAGAISKTDVGGTISVLDPGGFGAVTITKAITIDAAGRYAGILVNGTNGIVVNAGPTADVVLRGLTLDASPVCSTPGTLNGIRLIGGRSLRIEDTTIHGFPGAGIDAEPTADGATVTVAGSRVSDNCTSGLVARRAGGVNVLLTDSLVSGNRTGVLAGTGATVRIARDTIAANGTGVASEAGGTLATYGDNHLAGNVLDGTPTLDLSPPPPPPAVVTNTVTVPGPTVTVPAAVPPPATVPKPKPKPVSCRVPRLSGMTRSEASKALAKAHCALGTVRYRPAHGHRAGRIYLQTVKAGATRTGRTKVGITIDAHKPAPKAKAKAAIVGGATRTWVSGVGSDLNPCSRTAPCLTFAAALSKTTDGGTIDVLDPGEFGPVTVNAPVTIDGAGWPARIAAAPGGSAITVNAPAGTTVTLRGLQLANPGGCTAPGAGDGIHVISGGTLHVEGVTATGFAGAGVSLRTPTTTQAVLQNLRVTDGCTAGVAAQPTGGALSVTIDGASLDRDGTVGVLAGAGSLVRLGRSDITGNTTALATAGDGILQAWGDNHLSGNAAPGATPAPLALR